MSKQVGSYEAVFLKKKAKREKRKSKRKAKAAVPKPKARARPRRSAMATRSESRDLVIARHNAQSMRNPFNKPPMCLGSALPTFCSTLLARTSFALTNGCGAVAFEMGAMSASPIRYVAPLTTSTTIATTGIAFPNGTATAANASAARPLSAGIRAWVNLAATAAPGQVGAGLLPLITSTPLDGSTVSSLMSLTSTRFFRASSVDGPWAALWRPLDVEDYEFTSSSLSASYMTTSCPYIVFDSFPNGTTVTFEVIQHWEFTPSTPSTSALLEQAGHPPADIERVFSYMADKMGSVTLEGAYAAADGFLDLYTRYAGARPMTLLKESKREDMVEDPRLKRQANSASTDEEEGYFSPARPNRRVINL